MGPLLENLLESFSSKEVTMTETGSGVDSWITPQGVIVSISEINHFVDAVELLKEMGYEVSRNIADYERVFKTLGEKTGYIRMKVSGNEIDFEIIAPQVTSKQISAMKQLAESYSTVYFSVGSMEGIGFRDLMAELRRLGMIKESVDEQFEKILLGGGVKESSIDFPQKDLDPSIWLKEDDTYRIRPGIRRKILDVIGRYPDMDLIDTASAGISDAATIHIVGSITTNQYLEDSDVDVHIVVSKDSDFHGDEDFQNEVIQWFNDNRDEIGGYAGKHPIEIYLQYNPDQDLMSDGCYDLLADEWLAGPKVVPSDYDPYEDFSHIADDLRNTVEDADKLLGELKRDVIDYKVIEQAMKQLSPDQKGLFLGRLKNKLEEIEENIRALYAKRKDWVDARRVASKPSTPEEALKDVELAKKWKDTNAIFKFINRYRYLRTIRDLEELLEDDEISSEEVDVINNILARS